MAKILILIGLSNLLGAAPPIARPPVHPPPAMVMKATAYAQADHATAAGTAPRHGIVAADPTVLPLGTRIRISGAAGYSGVYLVTDTGGYVKGRHIDVFIPNLAAAKRFGVKRVRVQILQVGKGVMDARVKDEAVLRGP